MIWRIGAACQPYASFTRAHTRDICMQTCGTAIVVVVVGKKSDPIPFVKWRCRPILTEHPRWIRTTDFLKFQDQLFPYLSRFIYRRGLGAAAIREEVCRLSGAEPSGWRLLKPRRRNHQADCSVRNVEQSALGNAGLPRSISHSAVGISSSPIPFDSFATLGCRRPSPDPSSPSSFLLHPFPSAFRLEDLE